MEFFLQVVLILACPFYGARKGGVALGPLGGTGPVVVFAFHLPPGKPPVDAMLTIVAVVAASATLQASGGLDVLHPAGVDRGLQFVRGQLRACSRAGPGLMRGGMCKRLSMTSRNPKLT